MRVYQIFYICALFLVIGGAGIYFLSTTVILNPADDSASNLLGESIEADSMSVNEDIGFRFEEQQKSQRSWILFCCVTIGIILFVAGLVIKRKTEGPDLFIDRDEDLFEE